MSSIIRNKKDWRKISLTEEQLAALNKAEKQVLKPKLLKRIQCIKLKNKSWKHKEIADFLGVTMVRISDWLRMYDEGGIDKLLEWHHQGRVSKLTPEQQAQIKQRNEEKPFNNAKEAKVYIEEKFGITWHLHWVQKLLKKNFDCHVKKSH